MDYTPEAWDADFEDFRRAVAEDTMDVREHVVVCEHCDWMGTFEDVREQDFDLYLCPECGYPVYFADGGDVDDCPLDGDHESALASVGWGMDEDYGYFGGDEW